MHKLISQGVAMLHEPLNRPTLRRRDLAAGSLWTIPVVIFAAPAPAASTSPLVFPVIKSSCKYPGNSTPGCNKGYHFELAWTNQVPYYVTVDITSATAKATTGGASTTMPLIRHILYDFDGSTVVSTAEPFALGPTITNQPAAMDALDASNSANIAPVDLTINYEYSYNDGTQVIKETGLKVTVRYDSVSPCQSGGVVIECAT